MIKDHHFPHVEIKDFAEVVTGGTPSTVISEYWDNGTIPWLNSGELNNRHITRSSNYITESGLKNSNAKVMPPDTVLIALTGATTGVTALLKIEACANQSVTGILPSNNHDPKFLYFYLSSLRQKILGKSWGGAQKHISQGYVKDIKVPLPSLDEQRRIAAILDKADAIRRKRQESIHLTEEFLRSTFLEIFGDPVLNPKGWDTVRMEDIIEDGPQNGLYKHESDYGSGTPIVRIDSFYDGEITGLINLKRLRIDQGTIRKYRLRENDILINRVNSRKFLGKCAIVPKLIEDTVFESNMMRMKLRDDRVCPAYVINLFQHPYIKKQIETRAKDAVNQSSINQDDVKSLELRLPPVALQKKFMQVKTMANKIRARFNDIALVDNSLFNSLVKRAFQGKQ